ncbi:4-hydroxy-3-methylbut-2-enyl diphosphate reductase [Candidatus Nitrosacidococcus tergens]|uniref:4-hydroxy-3-methylbut-2-enyl diphosphate reductase n=1 Tax=Candidatus Nitrosacidococcus tergens TaxID=553981 RepID=A0A7G1Q932_9GAMM|nr:4-hydroxy-3-methylbut-2-enyl diphosphate reductase [Candidatus Nitrosacidococcus tergens]CAB1275444.1 1-hydroxy-2-methyl-2-(E)-butenyl 4-diphosphate reductase, 4Fe-4S protein [Candidatus Nitrosacidococcus tergens]
MEVTLSQPRGFCAGVVRAIEVVERALEIHGAPIYVLHEIVHNQHVIQDLQQRGVIFTENLNSIPSESVVIFSAHGVATAVVEAAKLRNLYAINATCPLVTKVHLQAQKYHRQGDELIIIGHVGHPEVEGTRGRVSGTVYIVESVEEVEKLEVKDPKQIAYVTQTTLSIDDTRDVVEALKKRFPDIHGPGLDDICYATQNRQNAVREISKEIDVLLVVGARNSSNSNRLREVGEQSGVASYLIQDSQDIDFGWFTPQARVGITAGASTPEILVQEVLDKLHNYGVNEVKNWDGVQESVNFRLPSSLLRSEKATNFT